MGRIVLLSYYSGLGFFQQAKIFPEGLQIDHINGNKIDNRNLKTIEVGYSKRKYKTKRKDHRDGQLFGCSFLIGAPENIGQQYK